MDDEEIPFPSNDNQILTNLTKDQSRERLPTADADIGSISGPYTVTDSTGRTATGNISGAVINHAPVADPPLQHHKTAGDLNGVWGYFWGDPDEDEVTYTFSGTGLGIWHFEEPQPDWAAMQYVRIPDTWGTELAMATWTGTETISGDTISGEMHVAVTDDPDFRWDVVVGYGDLDTWYGPESTGNVLTNDYSADGDQLHVESYNILIDSGTITIDDDGSYEFQVTDIDKFLLEDFEVEYTVIDDHGNSDTAVLKIELHSLYAGESVGYLGTGVTNGTKYNAPGVYENGLDPIGVYIDGAGANLFFGLGTVNKIEVLGGGAKVNYHAVEQSWIDATGPIELDGAFINNAVLNSTNGDIRAAGGGALNVGTARLNAGGSIGALNAGTVFYANATGNLDTVSGSGAVYHVSAGGNIEAVVSAYGFVNSVQAGGTIGAVTASTWINNVSAGTDLLGSVIAAGGGIGVDGAGGTTGVGGVSAGGKILGSVSAEGSIGYVYAGDEIVGAVQANSGGNIYQVAAGTGGGYYYQSYATPDPGAGNILGSITAAGSIGRVHAAGNLVGAVTATSGSLGTAVSGKEITAKLKASQHIGGVYAGTNLKGNVEATNGNIVFVTAAYEEVNDIRTGSIDNGTIKAKQSIGEVSVTVMAPQGTAIDPLDGSITVGELKATNGRIGNITADGAITSTITAKTSIGDVKAGQDISGSITTTTADIGQVTSQKGSVNAPVNSAGNIDGVYAKKTIGGAIDAITSIGNVKAETESILKAITAGVNIGDVIAGADLKKSITATAGSIGSILVGTFSGGSIGAAGAKANITAAKNIETIVVSTGQALGDEFNSFPSFFDSYNVSYSDSDSYSDAKSDKPLLPERKHSDGNLNGDVKGLNIGKIHTDGTFKGDATATGTLKSIWAIGSYVGAMSSQIGASSITTFATFAGSASTNGNAEIRSFDDTHADVRSSEAVVSVTSLGEYIGKEVYGKLGVLLRSRDDTRAESVASPSGAASVYSYKNIGIKSVDAQSGFVGGREDVELDSFTTRLGDALSAAGKSLHAFIDSNAKAIVAAAEEVSGSLRAGGDVKAPFVKDISSDIFSLGNVYIRARETIATKDVTAAGTIYMAASGIKGSTILSTGNSQWSNTPIFLNIFGDVENAEIRGSDSVTIYARGKLDEVEVTGSKIWVVSTATKGGPTAGVNGEFTSWGGGTTVASMGDVSGKFTGTSAAKDNLTVGVRGDFKATAKGFRNISIKAQDSVISHSMDPSIKAWGNVDITAGKTINSKIEADGNITVLAKLNIAGEISATGFESTIFGLAGNDFQATANADRRGSIEIHAGHISDGTFNAGAEVTLRSQDEIEAEINKKGSVAKVDVRAIGAIRQSTIFGGTVSIGAHDTVNQTQVTSQGPLHVDARMGISNLTATANETVIPSWDLFSPAEQPATLNVITRNIAASTLTGHGPVFLLSLGDADITAESKTSTLEIVARAQGGGPTLSGDVKSAKNMTLISTGKINMSSAASKAGLDVKAQHQIDGVFTASTDAYGETLIGEIKGTWASGYIGLNGETVDATATAQWLLNVVARQNVSGTLSSRFGKAFVTSILGNVDSVVTGMLTADVRAPLGSVTKNVASFGTTKVAAGINVEGTVTGGWQTDVVAVGSISNTSENAITALGTVYVESKGGSVNAGVKSYYGVADVTARKNITKKVEALSTVYVQTLEGVVSAKVNSSTADALVIGRGAVTGTVTGQRDAFALSLGPVTQKVHAKTGLAHAVSVREQVSGDVESGTDAIVIARGKQGSAAVSGHVDAGKHAIVISRVGNVTGLVEADENIFILSGGGVSGNVVAYQSAVVVAARSITGNITGENEHVSVVSVAGAVDSTITAGQSAGVYAGTTSVVTVDAADAIVLSGGAVLTVNLTASAGDGIVVADGDVHGTLNVTGGNAVVLATGVSTANLDADLNAFAYGFEGVSGTVDGGKNASVISLGPSRATVKGGENAFLFSFGSIFLSNVQAPKFAGAITLGSAYSATVSGDEGAMLWSRTGTYFSTVTSATKAATLISVGSVSTSTITGATDAIGMAIGSFSGTVTATAGFGGVIGLASAAGSLTTGAGALIISEGDANVGTEAGENLLLWALGQINGDYKAAQDSVAVAHGRFNARLQTGRDLLYVYGRDGVDGSLQAGRYIGNPSGNTDPSIIDDVFSFGDIGASLLAGTDASSDPDKGRIGTVGAHGNVSGPITAGQSIGTTRAGGQVTSTRSAPTVGAAQSGDQAVLGIVKPDKPNAIGLSLIAQATAEYEALFAERATLEASISDSRAERRTAQQELLDRISKSVADEIAGETAIDKAYTETLDKELAKFKAKVKAEAEKLAAHLRNLTYELHDHLQYHANDPFEGRDDQVEVSREEHERIKQGFEDYRDAFDLLARQLARIAKDETSSRNLVIDGKLAKLSELTYQQRLEYLETALEIGGYLPLVGAFADFGLVGISVWKGDYKGALFNLAAAAPGVGDLFAAGKFATKAVGGSSFAASFFTKGKGSQKRFGDGWDAVFGSQTKRGGGSQLLDRIGDLKFPFNDGNFRENVGKLWQVIPPEGYHAHHVFPQALESIFKKHVPDLDIHNPIFGAFWDADPHLKMSHAYETAWRNYLGEAPRSMDDITDFGHRLAKEFGFAW